MDIKIIIKLERCQSALLVECKDEIQNQTCPSSRTLGIEGVDKDINKDPVGEEVYHRPADQTCSSTLRVPSPAVLQWPKPCLPGKRYRQSRQPRQRWSKSTIKWDWVVQMVDLPA